MPATKVDVVFDMESRPPIPLGTYSRVEEDCVWYVDLDGDAHSAPEDCVRIVTVKL